MIGRLLALTSILMAFDLTARQAEAEEMLRGPQRHSLLVGGSRSGKTFELTSEVCLRAMVAPESRHAILRLHLVDVRQSIGMDTLPKVMRLRFAGQRYEYNRTDQVVTFPDKTQPKPPVSEGFGVWLAGLDDKDRVEKVLGKEMTSLYFNECSQIPLYSVSMALTRLAQKVDYHVQGKRFRMRNRALYDLNPVGTGHWSYRMFVEGKDPESFAALAHPDDYRYLYMNPGDNAVNLDPKYIESLMQLPERMRRRFFEGRYVAELDGALWTLEMIEHNRIGQETDPHATWQEIAKDLGLPEMRRIVVAVDPSGASGQFDVRADAIGIVVAGLGVDDHAYVFEDLTGLSSPEQWGAITCNAFWRHKADMVVAEQNFGGDMVRAIIQAHLHPVTKRPVGTNVPVSLVVSSRGKSVRAEPIAAMYERCVAAGTQVETASGPKPIEMICAGDAVWTRDGLRRVRWAGQTGVCQTIKLRTEAGELVCTAGHPVFIAGLGFLRAGLLSPTVHKIVACTHASTAVRSWTGSERLGASLARPNSGGQHLANLFDRIGNLGASGSSWIARVIGEAVGMVALLRCTVRSGLLPTAQYLMAGTSITSMEIAEIIALKIWSPLTDPLTLPGTELIEPKHFGCQRIGYEHQLNAKAGGRSDCQLNASATSAIARLKAPQLELDSVRRPVTRTITLGSVERSPRQPVYNLEVEDSPEFFANGFLVHNCKVHHIGRFPRLEDEMTNFTTAGYMGARSPNRCDALVFALTELFGNSLSFGLNEYYGAVAGELTAQKELHVDPNLAAAVDKAIEIAKVDVTPANGKNPTATCAKCGSRCIQRVPGGDQRCGSCGAQWGGPTVSMATQSRVNL